MLCIHHRYHRTSNRSSYNPIVIISLFSILLVGNQTTRVELIPVVAEASQHNYHQQQTQNKERRNNINKRNSYISNKTTINNMAPNQKFVDDTVAPPSPLSSLSSHVPKDGTPKDNSINSSMEKEMPTIVTPSNTKGCTTLRTNNKNLAAADVIKTPKRKEYLSWDDYFLAVAILSSKRSKDPKTPSGACIVDEENRIVGIGYNGFPRGCSDDVLPWADSNTTDATTGTALPWLHTQDPYVCHAESNAILNKCSDSVAGCRLYVMSFPCSDCAKVIIQSRIQEIIILDRCHYCCCCCNKNITTNEKCCSEKTHFKRNDSNDDKKDEEDNNVNYDIEASHILLNMAGVKIRYCRPSVPFVSLDFIPSGQKGITTGKALTSNSATSCCSSDSCPMTTEPLPRSISTDSSSSTTTSTTTVSEDATCNSLLQNNDAGTTTMTSPTTSTPSSIPEHIRNMLWEEAKYDPTTTNNENNSIQRKRFDYISWDDYFMAMAFLTAKRSKDPNTQVGACIVNSQNVIVGVGYNGFPRGCSDDILPWARSNTNPLHNKYMYVTHAEVNAILNKGSSNVNGATIYVAMFPCQNCAKTLIQAGISRIVYMTDPYHNTDGCRASRIVLKLANVTLQQYVPSVDRIQLNYYNYCDNHESSSSSP